MKLAITCAFLVLGFAGARNHASSRSQTTTNVRRLGPQTSKVELLDHISKLNDENQALRDSLDRKINTERVESVSFRGGSNHVNNDLNISYKEATVVKLVLNRGSWLAVFLLSLSLTSVVMSEFEHTLAEHLELSYFIPLLIGHGGNAGGQTVGAVLSALSKGEVNLRDWPRVLAKECLAG